MIKKRRRKKKRKKREKSSFTPLVNTDRPLPAVRPCGRFSDDLRPQKLYGLLGTGRRGGGDESPGPPPCSHFLSSGRMD